MEIVWNPVKEGLPETKESQRFFVTMEDGKTGRRFVSIAVYFSEMRKFISGLDCSVVAWADLPPVWKGKYN